MDQSGYLVFEDGSIYNGISFGSPTQAAGEVVFSTGMVGYPESLTDPSYVGQILIFTYPLLGNYGVPPKTHWESNGIKIAGLIVSQYIDTPSHPTSRRTLGAWLRDEGIPALAIPDTRQLTQTIRTHGTLLGRIAFQKRKYTTFYDPNTDNLVAKVSRTSILRKIVHPRKKTVLLFDCGLKENIPRCLLRHGVNVIIVPWDFDPFTQHHAKKIGRFDGIIISNGPGDPKKVGKTIAMIKKALAQNIPTLGICLGHQLLALAAGGDTRKLKFGHRSQNQPCIMEGTPHCYITTQNHGFAVSDIPRGFRPWFTNANDGSNEGIIHTKKPFMSVQFHPEARPGPTDTEWIFDYFLEKLE